MDERFSDFDSQLTPEEMEQDWIQWNDDLRKEIQELYASGEEFDRDFEMLNDSDPGYRDEDRWFNGEYEGIDYQDFFEEYDPTF
jgi:hypothetical protein